MKHSNFFFGLQPTIRQTLIALSIMFVFSGSTTNSQTVEVSQEKVLISTMAAPWGFTFINSDEVLFTEKQGKMYRYIISTNSLSEISGVPAISQNGLALDIPLLDLFLYDFLRRYALSRLNLHYVNTHG